MKLFSILLALFLFATTTSIATTINVPADQPTIQAGIDAAVDGDTVLVAPGTFTENVSFGGKLIVVTSSAGALSTTIIPLNTSIPIISFVAGENNSTELTGFTIEGSRNGPAVSIQNSAPVLTQNIFRDHIGPFSQSNAIIHMANGDPQNPPPIIKRNVFYNNPNAFINIWTNANPVIFENNTIDGGIRGVACYAGTSIIKNNIIINCSDYGFFNSGAFLDRKYNDIWSNSPNYLGAMTPDSTDIAIDPIFIDIANNDYHLQTSSPCVNAGDPNPAFNDPDGSRNDIGAFPVSGCIPTVINVPTDFPTIQMAVDSACTGDTIQISSGTFSESIDIQNKTLSIFGSGIGTTILTGTSGSAPAIECVSSNVSIRGLTISSIGIFSGGIIASFSDININQVMFLDCHGCTNAALGAVGSQVKIRNSHFIDCITDQCSGGGEGAAIGSVGEGATLLVDSCVFMGNRTSNEFGFGYGGVFAGGDSCSILNSLFENNGGSIGRRSSGGGNPCLYSSSDYNLVVGNTFRKNSLFAEIDLPPLGSGGVFGLTGIENSVIGNVLDSNTVTYFPISVTGALTDLSINGQVIRVSGSNNVIQNNTITGNSFTGGVFITQDASETIAHVSLSGMGVQVAGPSIVTDNLIANNTALVNATAYDGCLACTLQVSIEGASINATGPVDSIYRNVIFNNQSTLTNQFFVVDTISTYSEIYSPGTGSIECNDVFSTAPTPLIGGPSVIIGTNFSENPYFCPNSYDVYDFSICLPSNNICAQPLGGVVEGCLGTPTISGLSVAGILNNFNVVPLMPELSWSTLDPVAGFIDSFEVSVGTDTDWTFAEMWNPAPFASVDTFVTYAGAPLVDGATYYLRLRVHNSLVWSDWFETSFRMNSLPSVPLLAGPADAAVVGSLSPTLYAQNSSDAEADTIIYIFELYEDFNLNTLIEADSVVNEQADSTGWAPVTALAENSAAYWRVKAFDGFEFSDWSETRMFWVNATKSAPAAFALDAPSDSARVYDMLPTFRWQSSGDNDPGDSALYRLSVAIDSGFAFVATVDSLSDTFFVLADSLDFADDYWWKVEAFDANGAITSSSVNFFPTWVLGDANSDGGANIADVTFLINRIFGGGIGPNPPKAGDINGDCTVNIADVTFMIARIFTGGEAPKIGCAP